ncbi:Zn-dependent hydrolase [Sinorhizobium terangae]|uniref:Zn-dependent hydrolase n=1 Tax=Sinorhizobium terangae TaxID=110322 RepID=A0A6N7L902_SINTE|nr:Zn-dependent hydrolase [Sinorhizobium terangae]MBB4185453.1 N-carbamoyl-L-amino-acid hydrolase [Sinorhizobium terangae]MQX13214.1 Zn-dependent hydrolase [Sinorhizobium terangae]WFU46474.1 Zn-dependent hydrolase [Sinorhizobium terangae]
MTASQTNLPVDARRIADIVRGLERITEPDHPYTRRAFTPLFLEGRAFLEERFSAAGLDTRIDAAGNLIGRRKGRKPALGTIMLGSHSDTVPEGGRFDGIAGVAAALEVARSLSDAGIELDHDLEIVDFLAEEVSIFGVSCVGSRGMAGVVPDGWLSRAHDELTLRQGIVKVGGDPSRLPSSKRSDVKAFLELHIEQGPVLEAERLDIGVVTAISGITRIEIIVEGQADHAGTTPMGRRRDALVAASRLVLEIEKLGFAHAAGEGHFTATVGEFEIEPNAANVVPSRARLLIDARAELRPQMDVFIAEVEALAARIAEEVGVTITPKVISDNHPTPGDPLVLATLEAACGRVGARHRLMASGAGHDTAWMGRITRSAMIFIPCRDGRSHAPEEWAENDDIALGAAVLLEAVLRLDGQLQEKT